jgi:hypothetical protein
MSIGIAGREDTMSEVTGKGERSGRPSAQRATKSPRARLARDSKRYRKAVVSPAQYGANTRYLAVEAGAILSADVLDLWPKLINSETATEFFAHGRNTYSNLNLTGIQIYDTSNNRFVGPGFVSVDLPRRNHLARWDGYIARFIGTGWSWW